MITFKVTVNEQAMSKVMNRLNGLAEAGQYKAEIGWLDSAPEEIKRRARVMEYEMARRPGYVETWAILRRTRLHIEQNLSEDVRALLSAGHTGYGLMNELATMYKERLINYLLTVSTPPLRELTVARKRWGKQHGLSSPSYPPEQIWVDTAETLEAIDAQVVPR